MYPPSVPELITPMGRVRPPMGHDTETTGGPEPWFNPNGDMGPSRDHSLTLVGEKHSSQAPKTRKCAKRPTGHPGPEADGESGNAAKDDRAPTTTDKTAPHSTPTTTERRPRPQTTRRNEHTTERHTSTRRPHDLLPHLR